MLIRQKGELTSATFKSFKVTEIKILLKWKGAKPASTRKADIVEAYITANKPPIIKIWTRAEEAALVALQDAAIPLKDTALGVAAGQMARAVSNNLDQLDEDSISTLRNALDTLDPQAPSALL